MGLPSDVELKNIHTNALHKKIARRIVIPRQKKTFLPEEIGEGALRMVSQENATRVAPTILCPQGQTPRGKLLFLATFPDGFQDPNLAFSCSPKAQAGDRGEGARITQDPPNPCVLSLDFPTGSCRWAEI